MKKILITHPIAQATIDKYCLDKINENFTLGEKKAYFCQSSHEEILYTPDIGSQQIPDEKNDPTIIRLEELLISFQPDVLIVGSNAVPERVLDKWRLAVGNQRDLMVIRRGVDIRAIALNSAEKNNIKVTNLPGVNSPYVAQHMMKFLALKLADNNSKIAIIGVGNIGKEIVKEAIENNLNTHVFTPSLVVPEKRNSYLMERGINPQQVVCHQSITTLLEDATHVAIAIPWLDREGKPQAGIITETEIKSLRFPAIIVSASVPRIFSPEALTLMNQLGKENKILVRIDTAQRRAEEFKPLYPYIKFAHNEAFASPRCQEALDNAMLEKARKFFNKRLN